ncbi:T9SS type A sorting domain-containing protein [Mucilaginibacter flavidus]|uniref:T9SS type A sorting domain-containing protein n=1 Tax=Mucilaginibacter flavidus TaxID=2949309 RepID=UPI0020934165|nr:T9SS type A sorting domain-containing protein [Mucilaginibacter flavidus]MCO5950924.1 T9SS type A sorting domain-containing protein [Mucilaginibacter flavidus]
MIAKIKPYYHNKACILRILICGIVFSLFFNTTAASTITWTGAGTCTGPLCGIGIGTYINQTDWSNSDNWSPKFVPGSSDDAVFNELLLGYTVQLTAAVTVKSITVNSTLSLIGGITLDTNGKTLTLSSSLNVGAVSVLFPTSFTFTGTGAITLNTAINAYAASNLYFGTNTSVTISSATVTSYNNSTISNLGTVTATASVFNISGSSSSITNSGTFNLGPTSIIYLTGASAGVSNSGTFTLLSDATGSAAIGAISSGTAGFSGQYNVQRFLTGGSAVSNGRYVYRGYRLMSSPVNAGLVSGKYPYTINYIAASAIVSGAKSSFGTLTGNPTIYVYSEDYTPSNASFTGGNFKGVTDISMLTSPYTLAITSNGTSKALYVGNGFMFFFRGDKTHSIGTSPGKTSYPFVAPESVVFTATGNLNQGSYTVNNWQTGSRLLFTTVTGNSLIQGFYLVGNPYASTIDWEATNSGGIVATNIDPNIYVLDPVTNQYSTYSSATHAGNPVAFTGKIASGQGFFVKANNTSPSLVFNETAKSPTTVINAGSGNLMMGTPAGQAFSQQLFRLKLFIDSLNYDDIAIGFKSTASSKYDLWEDTEYLAGPGASTGFASMSADSVPLAVNFLPLPKKAPQVIKLHVNAIISGRLTIEKTQLDSLPKIYELWLMDKYKRDSLDIRNNATYSFDIDRNDAGSFGDNRFELVIRQNKALGIHLLDFKAVKAPGGVQATWKVENEENYTNFTVERSIDNGTNFSVLGGFASNSQGVYSFMDKNPANAVNIYRVKIEDLNGTIGYTKEISVGYGSASQLTASANINIYPNPARTVINLSLSQPVLTKLNLADVKGDNRGTASTVPGGSYSIEIISVSGAVVKSVVSTQPNWQGDVSTLQSGTYILQVLNNKDKSAVGKVTFVKL